MTVAEPRLVVFTTLFPSAAQPMIGLFIRERMFRVAKMVALTVVALIPVLLIALVAGLIAAPFLLIRRLFRRAPVPVPVKEKPIGLVTTPCRGVST